MGKDASRRLIEASRVEALGSSRTVHAAELKEVAAELRRDLIDFSARFDGWLHLDPDSEPMPMDVLEARVQEWLSTSENAAIVRPAVDPVRENLARLMDALAAFADGMIELPDPPRDCLRSLFMVDRVLQMARHAVAEVDPERLRNLLDLVLKVTMQALIELV